MVARQDGMLLLPVVIVLSIMGALAYGMTRQGSVGMSAVDAQYDMEVTRYLAEAGLRLAKWQNEKIGCGSTQRFANVQIPGVAGSVNIDGPIVLDHEKFMVSVTATSARGSVSSVSRDKMMFFDRARRYPMTLPASALKDTYISSLFPTSSYGSSNFLEATDNKEHMLVNVSVASIPTHARVMSAGLSLYMFNSTSVQTERKLAVHAVTRAWSDGSATWNSPWSTSPGGSIEAQPLDTVAVPSLGRYTWNIASLMRRWDSGALGNYGVLFKPVGLNEARFYSINSAVQPPRLDIEYNLRCD